MKPDSLPTSPRKLACAGMSCAVLLGFLVLVGESSAKSFRNNGPYDFVRGVWVGRGENGSTYLGAEGSRSYRRMAAVAGEFLGLEGDEKLVKIVPDTPATIALAISAIVALALWGLFLITIGAISKASQSPTGSSRSSIIDSVLLTLPLINVYWSARWAKQVLNDERSGRPGRRLAWLFSSISAVDTLFCLLVLISARRYPSLIEAAIDRDTATAVDISSVNALAFLLVFFGAWMIARMQSLGPALEDSSTDSGPGDSSHFTSLKLS
jgi:hypothetical protein